MSVVLKIKYGESLRRLVVLKSANGRTVELSFAQLETKIREYFNVPASSKLVITYADQDGDTVTMTEDQELHDACLVQLLNPLRLFVSVAEESARAPQAEAGRRSFDWRNEIKPLFESALALKSLDHESVKEALEPLLKEGFISDILQSISKHAPGDHAESSVAEPVVAAAASAAPAEAPKTESVFHYNVQCDVCGLSPIVGPRFKSLTKHDYDLCLSCFTEVPKGSERDYVRHDRPLRVGWGYPGRAGRCPALNPRSRSVWGRDCASNPHLAYQGPWGREHYAGSGPYHREGSWAVDSAGTGSVKSDSRFVCDVTIPDGTVVSPGSRLVKIWKLRNSGKCPWPSSTKLVKVSGDSMGPVSAVTLQMPSETGVLPEAEVDVAVDLVAPSKPGRYVTYWRLMNPYGVKFGHRVWAVIQVSSAPGEVENFTVVEDEAEAEVVSIATTSTLAEGEPEEVAVVVVNEENDADESVDEGFSLVDASEAEVPREAEKPEDVEAEKGEDVKKTDESADAACVLETMGFSDRSLIAEFLAKNENDVQKTIDDLIAAAEWDPILVELEEMGFYDAEMNRRLMIKNKGSFKRVVKELVQMQNSPPK